MVTIKKITILNTLKSNKQGINKELYWISSCLGLFNERDKEKSCFRLFIELLKSTQQKKLLSSDELANRLNLSRGTVIHHVNKLVSSGLIIANNNRYMLRGSSFSELINLVETDLNEIVGNIKKSAKEIDKELKLI